MRVNHYRLRLEIVQVDTRMWMWQFVAHNKNIVACSSVHNYTTKGNAKKNALCFIQQMKRYECQKEHQTN